MPPARNGVPSFASASRLVSRGCSSRSTTVGAPFFAGSVTATISAASRPLAWAASARCWLRSAKASWSARETANSAATFSPVSGIESMPYCCFMSGFTKRQPIVVSNICWVRVKAASGFDST